ncbi:MAG TPA: glutathione-disulfide reductase [Kofleriaceae bacterium]|nr:glutathione-disulfide reductase [Kofleriaceae bacterium]
MKHDVDLFVIGGGSGGVRAARIAASHGARVAIAEESRWGGTCVIRGCVPKKLLVYAAEFAADVADARGFGWEVAPPKHDWGALIAAKDREIDRLSGLYLGNLRKAGVTIHEDRAWLVDAHTVEVGERRVTAAYILIATGGSPRHLPIPGGELAVTSDDVFHLPALPQRIVIVGGGYIGVEFAHIFAGLGATVTLIHRGEVVLPGFDHEVRAAVERGLRHHGITVVAGDEPRALERTAAGALRVRLATTSIEADLVMSAIGRRPNTGGLGLPEVGVALDPRGAVPIDEWSRTSVPHIHAVGDVTGRIALTPIAIREGHAFADSVFGRRPTPIQLDLIPTAVFGQPPAATVGLSEEMARTRGFDVQVFRADFRPMRHTLTGRDERTLMKMVIDARTRRVLGLHMVGADAPEIIQAASVAITMGATKEDFDRTLAIHPTAAEELVLLR